MKIRSIKLHDLHNDEYWQFVTRLNDHIRDAGAAALRIDALYARFRETYKQLDEAYKKILKSALSEEIDALDRTRDETYRGMKDAVQSSLRHFKADVKAAAKRVGIVLDGYGDVTRLGKSAQTAATANLLADLNNKHADDVETLDLVAWVVELDRLNHELESRMETRFDETAARTDLSMREVRLAMDRVYYDIAFRVESLQEVLGGEPDAPWAAFIGVMNTIIDYTKNIVAQRHGRAAAKKTPAETPEDKPEDKPDAPAPAAPANPNPDEKNR